MRLLGAVVAAVLLSLCFATRALAAPVAQIDGATEHMVLAPYLDVLEDTTAALTLDEVQRPEVAARFTPFQGPGAPNYGFTRSAIWARLVVQNTSDAPLERWLVVDAATASTIEVFRDGEPRAVQGVLHPRSDRELPRPSFSFRLALQPRQTRIVYVRGSGDSEVQLPLELWQVGALIEKDRILSMVLDVSYGVLLTMALYNLFLYFFVRDRTHLYYAAAVVCAAAWLLCIDGKLLDVLPARFQTVPHAANEVAVCGYVGFAFLFVRRFLALPSAYPRLDRALSAYLVVLYVSPVLYLVGVIDYRVQNLIAAPTFVVAQMIWVALAVLRARDGVVGARYFALGWAVLLVVSGINLLQVRGSIPIAYGYVPAHVGFALEAVFLSLALAEAARRRNEEVTQLNDELRHQVAERSRELTDALARTEGFVSPAALEVGGIFDGRYRVVRALGSGGMGAVYEVERTRDRRRFALKVITKEISARNAARFAQEAEIGARIHHDNLVSILDVGIAAGATPFLVMELVLGGSLEDQRKRFGDVRWALPILRQIATGLAELHARRIVHRDLKPGNVLLVEAGGGDGTVAKISDFGISRFGAVDDATDVDAEGATLAEASAEASPRALTQTGALMGTPVYMPPEALLGPARSPSADLFSFGIMAYEMLAGRSPFVVPPVLLARSGKPIPEPDAIEGVQAKVGTAILGCLRADPAQRPKAKEVADALGARPL